MAIAAIGGYVPARIRPALPRKMLMTADAVGGVWSYALELAGGLALQGIHIELALLGPLPSPGQLDQATRIPGVNVVTTGLSLDWTAHSEDDLDRAAHELKALARATRAELVHLNAPGQAGLTRWDVPLVVAAHSCVATWWRTLREDPLPPELHWRAQRTAQGLAIADGVIAPSRSFAHQLRTVYGGFPVSVVYNARTYRVARGTNEGDKVLTAGRLWDQCKNVAIIDKAAGLSRDSIYAAGPTRGPNGEHIDCSNLRLLGSLDGAELKAWYQRAAIFVSLSKYEPFGLSVLEAAQAGAALVLSDIETFRELWRGAACFVAADDAAEAARAIDWLNCHGDVRRNLARRANERAKRYSVARMLASTLSVYRHASSQHVKRSQPRSAA